MPAAQNFGFRHSATGETLYFTVRGETPGVDHFQLWNQDSAAMEDQDNANWTSAKYCCALSENPAGGYHYRAVLPSVPTSRPYMVDIYLQAGGSPALTDTLVASFLGVMDASGLSLRVLAADVQQWLAATAPANTGDAYAAANTRLPAALTANGNIKASLVEILTTALTETSGLIAAAFKKFFNVAAPTGTVNSLPSAASGAAGGLPVSAAGGLDMDDLASDASAAAASAADAAAAAASAALDAASIEARVPADPAAVGDAMTLATDAISAAAISTAALNKLCKVMGVTTSVNAAGTELKVYDTSGVLVATLTKTGTDPVLWTAVFA